jgi:soluble lytic murein transglycosylase
MVTAALAAALLAVTPTSPLPYSERDLAPVLGEDGARRARADVAAGRHARLAARLAEDARPEVRFLRAVALDASGRPSEALAALEGLDAALPDLADRVAFLRGRALEALGRDEAVAAYAAVPDASVRAAAARLARARLLGAAGLRDSALEALAPLLAAPPTAPGTPDPGAAALLLAGRLQASGAEADPAGARRAFLECWAGHPLAPEARRCLRALRALPGKHRAGSPPEQVARRAEGLLDGNHTAPAAAQLRALLPRLPTADAEQPVACRARLALGRAYRRQRRNAAAIALLRPVAERCADPGIRAGALHLLAEASAARGARGEAIATYRRLARSHPASPLAHQALFSAADLLARDGRAGEAAEAFGAVAHGPPGTLRDEARFRLAWLAKRSGDADAAIAHLLAIEADARGRDPYEEARAAYWRARLLAAAGHAGREAARAIWADLAARFPAGYYGVVARARLGERDGPDGLPPHAPAATPAPETHDPGDLEQDRHFRAGIALLRIGLHRAAAEELNAIDPARLGDHGARPALLVADLLHRAGDARAASLLLRTVAPGALRRTPDARNLRAWRVAYPPAFREHVARWAPRARVPVDLFHALIREESALDPRAVSPAGAVGLSQLMLPTARQVARALRMRPPTRADLTVPAVSIRIGTRYLGDLVRRFGSIPIALASYNAGPGAVSGWLEERGHLDVDEFVEEIPYDETRGYVKRVIRSFATYRILYGDGADDPLDLLGPSRERPPPAVSARQRPGAPRRGSAARGAPAVR